MVTWFEHIQLVFDDIELGVEKHVEPIDMYYQHKHGECVRVRTRYVVKVHNFRNSAILKNTDLGVGDEKQKMRWVVKNVSQPAVKIMDNLMIIDNFLRMAHVEDKFLEILNLKQLDLILDALSQPFVVPLQQAAYRTPNIIYPSSSSPPISSSSILERVLLKEEEEQQHPDFNITKKIKNFIRRNEDGSDYNIKFMEENENNMPFINPFRGTQIIENELLANIGEVLMENTLKAILKALAMCYKHYVEQQRVFFLLLVGGLLGFYQNEMLVASEVTFPLLMKWETGDTNRFVKQSFKNQYQWVFFDMVKRTEWVVKTLNSVHDMKLSYDTDTYNIFEMCYFSQEGKNDIGANCILSSMIEACYFQEMEKLPLNKIFVGLEMAPDSKFRKTMTSLRNDKYALETRHATEGRFATHWTSRFERTNGRAQTFRSMETFEHCGLRNLNFAEHREYIAQSMLYQQIYVMARRLKNTLFKFLKNSTDRNTFTQKMQKMMKAYVASQLNGILFLLLRTKIEAASVEELYKDYIANAERDAKYFFDEKLPSKETLRRLFKTFFTGIDDKLAAAAN